MFWITVVVAIALGVLASVYLVKHVIIIATSIIGSYISVRGPSVLIGGFPAEGEIIDLIQREEYGTLNKVSLI